MNHIPRHRRRRRHQWARTLGGLAGKALGRALFFGVCLEVVVMLRGRGWA